MNEYLSGVFKSKLIQDGHLLFSSARSLVEDDAFRAVSAGYEDHDLKRRSDCRFPVVYCGDVCREKEVTHYHCSSWAELE
jgi:hypothetical protein